MAGLLNNKYSTVKSYFSEWLTFMIERDLKERVKFIIKFAKDLNLEDNLSKASKLYRQAPIICFEEAVHKFHKEFESSFHDLSTYLKTYKNESEPLKEFLDKLLISLIRHIPFKGHFEN